jgi:hypothetical protein
MDETVNAYWILWGNLFGNIFESLRKILAGNMK